MAESRSQLANTSQPPPQKIPEKDERRKGYMEWNDYFMTMALLASRRSKDPSTQVGACIVSPDKMVVGIGWNGMPQGSDDYFPWGKTDPDPLDRKRYYVCHAEMNAITLKTSNDFKDCTIYVLLFPCNECAKLIIQSGIKEVVYLSDKHADDESTKASKRMFDSVGITWWQYTPKETNVVLDFSTIEKTAQQQQ